MIKRKEIFTETRIRETVRIIRRDVGSGQIGNCENCDRIVRWVDLPEAAIISGIDAEQIESMITDGLIDVRITKQFAFLICENSLSRINSAK